MRNEVQKKYPDYPADAIPMLQRILIEDFENIKKEETIKIFIYRRWLKWLIVYLQDKSHATITIPALGCGHGGLDWEEVKND